MRIFIKKLLNFLKKSSKKIHVSIKYNWKRVKSLSSSLSLRCATRTPLTIMMTMQRRRRLRDIIVANIGIERIVVESGGDEHHREFQGRCAAVRTTSAAANRGGGNLSFVASPKLVVVVETGDGDDSDDDEEKTNPTTVEEESESAKRREQKEADESFDPAETLNSDAQKDLEEIHFSTMTVTTPKKKTTIQTIQTRNGQLGRGVAKKHGASPGKRRERRRTEEATNPKRRL